MKKILLLCLVWLSGVALLGRADVIFSYQANDDPTTMGWSFTSSGTTATVSGGVEGDGREYWQIDDFSTGMTQYVSNVLPSYATTRGCADGWTYSMTVKVLDCDAGSAACVLRLLDGWRVWLVSVTESGVEVGGNVIVSKNMTDRYHTVQMVCDPSNTNEISVYVDGEECLRNYSTALIYQGYGAGFGSGSTPGAGSARYSEVTFETGVNLAEPELLPFFPGWFDSLSSGTVSPADVAASGGKAVILYEINPDPDQRILAYLDSAEACGVGVVLSVKVAVTSGDMTDLASIVGAYKNHPALIGWSVADEPILAGVPASNCESAYDYIKSQSSKPVYLCFSYTGMTGASFSDYDDAYDVMMVDLYLFGPGDAEFEGLSGSRTVCNILKNKAEAAGKPFVMVVQAYGYCTWLGSYMRLPTFTEERHLIIHALFNGSQGVALFGDMALETSIAAAAEVYPYDGLQWRSDVAVPISAELDFIERSVRARLGPMSGVCTPASSSIRTMGYQDPDTGRYHVIAINDTANTVSTGFQLSLPVTIVKAELGFIPPGESGFSRNVTGGMFGDAIRPYDVRHYILYTAEDLVVPGDANGDGAVDVGDLGILAANYGTTSGASWELGDFNGDGGVDVGDLGILAANYGTGVSSAVDFDADYAEFFGDDVQEDVAESSLCSLIGLPLALGLFLLCVRFNFSFFGRRWS